MGTNYYTFLKPCPDACEHCSLSRDIHLGKSSAGWKFLFNLNGKKHYTTVGTMRVFLQGKVIRDEYGATIPHTKFWRMVEQKQKEQSQRIAEGGHNIIAIGQYEFLDSDFS